MPAQEDQLTERQLAKESFKLLRSILSELQKQNEAADAARRAAMIPTDDGPASSPTGGLTNDELRASPLQVLGPLTNTELRAAAFAVTVTGTVTTTIGLTDAQLRASPVTVQFGSAQAITVAALPLPAGAATEATVSGLLTNTQLRASPVPVSGTVGVSGVVEIANDSGSPIPVSASSLPLPSGASTEATLATMLTLTGFQARVPVPGQAAMAASMPVAIANNQSAIPVTGTFFQATQPISAASLPLPTGATTEATLANVLTTAAFQARHPVLGQAAMAASMPVVLANNQSSIPVTGSGNFAITAAALPLPTGAATETTLGTLLTLTGFNARIPANGQATMAASLPVVLASNHSTITIGGNTPAGTPSATTVLTVQGHGSGTPLPVSGPLTDTQLRASAVPVSLSGNQATNIVQMGGTAVSMNTGVRDAGTQRVTICTNDVVPVSQGGSWSVSIGSALPADTNEIGKVQLSDGTDLVSILPLRSQPASTDKGLGVINLPMRAAMYACATIEIATAITIGVKELLALWNTGTKDKYITEIWVSSLITTASTAGRSTIRVSTITSAPTGGTEEAKVDISGAGASDMANTMRAKTGGGAIGSTFLRKEWLHATQPVGRVSEIIFQATNRDDGIILRGGSNAGISIDEEWVVAHTALVEQVTVGVRWLEL